MLQINSYKNYVHIDKSPLYINKYEWSSLCALFDMCRIIQYFTPNRSTHNFELTHAPLDIAPSSALM